jgi:hypothetical protein
LALPPERGHNTRTLRAAIEIEIAHKPGLPQRGERNGSGNNERGKKRGAEITLEKEKDRIDEIKGEKKANEAQSRRASLSSFRLKNRDGSPDDTSPPKVPSGSSDDSKSRAKRRR